MFKASIHLCVFALVSACCGYNSMAYGQRGERRLLLNALVYAAVMIWEAKQVVRHLQDPDYG